MRPSPTLSPRNRVGLILAVILGLVGIPMVLRGAPDPGQVGPPLVVLAVESICGVITVVAAVLGWRTGSRRTLRLAAGAQVVSVLTAVPALFVDRPSLNKLLLALLLWVTLTTVVLLLSPSRRNASSDTSD